MYFLIEKTLPTLSLPILPLCSVRINLLFLIETCLIITLTCHPYSIQSEILHGTTILNWPYVSQKPNKQFEGFCIDLLNELAPIMGIAYTLSVVPDGQYGGWLSKNGTVNGMIGQVANKKADFAIGDLTVLSNRARFVDFTLPFLSYGLSALVRRDVLDRFGNNIRTFKDLSEQTAIPYGVKKHGSNLPLFHDSPVVAKMYSFMDTHPSVFVKGEREGLHRVKTERYAFITESPFVEYVVQRDCELVAIDDRRKHFEFEYAIAVPKGSPLKNRFSAALRKLQNEGQLKVLKDKYWSNPHRNCPDDPNFNSSKEFSSGIKFFLDKEKLMKPSINENQREEIQSSGQYRQPGRLRPHENIDDEDVELIRPRPDQNRRNGRPIRPINRRNGVMSGKYNLTTATIFIVLSLIIYSTLCIG